MFKRRCHTCVTPLAALACYAQSKITDKSTYDHFGIVVPGSTPYSNPNILEATSQGIVSRDLSDRLRYSRSSSIVLLPLNVPGERRDGPQNKEISKSTSMQIDKVRSDFEDALSKSAERQVKTSQYISYENMHSTLTLFGGIVRNYVPLSSTTKEKIYKGPLNPSCMIVLEMLNKSGALSRQTKEGVLKREDCGRLRGEEIEMRPGWRYGKEVNLRN